MTRHPPQPRLLSAGPEHTQDVAELCWAYRAHLVEATKGVPGIVETYYAQDAFSALIAKLPDIHARPSGDILLAALDGEIVGCAMYYPLADFAGTCEIKRIFVQPQGHGHGLGAKLTAHAMAQAKKDGHRRMVLDTMRTLTPAIAIYKSLGFEPTPPSTI